MCAETLCGFGDEIKAVDFYRMSDVDEAAALSEKSGFLTCQFSVVLML